MPQRDSSAEGPKRRGKPATTPEAKENRLISMAVDLAEKQLRDGTASSQVISHYLKLGTSREQLEQRKLEKETRLLDAKVESLESTKRVEELYNKALGAMRMYSGDTFDDD